MLDAATQNAFKRYHAARKQKAANQTKVTDSVVAELKDVNSRVCPLICAKGEIARGEVCVAAPKPQPVAKPQRSVAEVPAPVVRRAPVIREPVRVAPPAAAVAPSRPQQQPARPLMLGF